MQILAILAALILGIIEGITGHEVSKGIASVLLVGAAGPTIAERVKRIHDALK